jgi:hypothetical protein
MDPFLSIDDFANEFGRTLTEAETEVATRFLQVASDWIRGKKADVDPLAAAEVVFEVTRDAINYGAYERLSGFTNVTGNRTEAGTFDMGRSMVRSAVEDYVTDRQKRLLGIPLRAGPVGSFPCNDFGHPPPLTHTCPPPWPWQWSSP